MMMPVNSALASLTTMLSRGLPSVRATSMTLSIWLSAQFTFFDTWSIQDVAWFYFLIRVWGCSFDSLHQWEWIIETAWFALWKLAVLSFYNSFSVLFELLCASSQAHPYMASCFPFFKETSYLHANYEVSLQEKADGIVCRGGKSPSSFKVVVQVFAVYPASDRISMFMKICILFDAPGLF